MLTENWKLLTTQEEILNAQTKFYKSLCLSKPQNTFNLIPIPDSFEKSVAVGDEEMYDSTLLLCELFDALMTLKSNQAGGIIRICL